MKLAGMSSEGVRHDLTEALEARTHLVERPSRSARRFEDLKMTMNIGPQYKLDDPFKAAARLHQSNYRARVLGVDYAGYGNRLTEVDGRKLLNYYDGLGVREALRKRYPAYSKTRDEDMLRSEHIPFNMLAPLSYKPDLIKLVLKKAFGLELKGPFEMKLEWAPEPADKYLGDMTSFDAYIQGQDAYGKRMGIGIEVKNTEREYRIGKSEAKRVHDRGSTYWTTTHESGLFVEDGREQLGEDDLRQIWRNHLLGLAMVMRKDIEQFVSVTLYPTGNKHFTRALVKYQGFLETTAQRSVRGCTFEQYIDCLHGDSEIEAWKQYLMTRYLFEVPAEQ